MLRFVLSLPLLALLLATPALSQSEKPDTKDKVRKLELGKDLPGPFQPYNVTGKHASRYHCLVTQASLDPVVILFVRDLDFTDALQTLEMDLNKRIVDNPNVRLSSFTVFISDELPKIVEDDDKRDELAAKVKGLAEAKKLTEVVLCLDSKSDLESYNLDDNAWATVVLVNRYQVVALQTLTKEQLNSEKVAEIMEEVGKKLGATRK